jgi:hypothetical protein
MSRSFNHDRAAMILCDALVMGDRSAAQKHRVTQRSIQGWRTRLENDEKLRKKANELLAAQEKEWASQIPEVLSAAMLFFQEAFIQNKTASGVLNPNTIVALTGTLETIADIELTRSIIVQRLNRLDNQSSQN